MSKTTKSRKPNENIAVRIVLTILIWFLGCAMIVPFIWKAFSRSAGVRLMPMISGRKAMDSQPMSSPLIFFISAAESRL